MRARTDWGNRKGVEMRGAAGERGDLCCVSFCGSFWLYFVELGWVEWGLTGLIWGMRIGFIGIFADADLDG